MKDNDTSTLSTVETWPDIIAFSFPSCDRYKLCYVALMRRAGYFPTVNAHTTILRDLYRRLLT